MRTRVWAVYTSAEPDAPALKSFKSFDEAREFATSLHEKTIIRYTTIEDEWSRVINEYFIDEYNNES